MSDRRQKRLGPIYLSLEQLRSFRLYERSDIRRTVWGVATIALLAIIGFVASVLIDGF